MRREICISKAIRTQTFHATKHATAKTNNYAISIDNVCKIVKAIESGAKKHHFHVYKNIFIRIIALKRVDYIPPAVIS